MTHPKKERKKGGSAVWWFNQPQTSQNFITVTTIARKKNVFWVLRDYLCSHHPPSPLINMGSLPPKTWKMEERMPLPILLLRSKWDWVFLQQTRILRRMQLTRHFIEFIVVETIELVGSDVNVILMRQICGQRSSRAAKSKRHALTILFCERICYIFPISKHRRD